jgi:hypothetical protein
MVAEVNFERRVSTCMAMEKLQKVKKEFKISRVRSRERKGFPEKNNIPLIHPFASSSWGDKRVS